MSSKYYLEKLNGIVGLIKRMPMAVLCCLTGTTSLIMASSIGNGKFVFESNLDDHFVTTFMASLVGLLWFIPFTLFCESKKIKAIWHIPIGIFLYSFLVVGVVTNQDRVPIFILSLITLSAIAPFIGSQAPVDRILFFNYGMITRTMCILFGAFLAWAALFIIYYMETEVLGLVLDASYLYNAGYILWGIVVPLCFIYCLPSRPDFSSSTPKVASIARALNDCILVLVNYTVVPLILFYYVIIYFYAVMIIVTRTLPKGTITWMVGGLGSVGIVAYFICHDERYATRLTRFFRRTFFKLLIIPLLLMGFAISIRVQEYGLTTSRYIVVVFLLWLSFCVLFYFLKRTTLFQLSCLRWTPFFGQKR